MTVRLEAARAALLAVVSVYKPVHKHITPEFETKLTNATAELEAAAVELASEKLANYEAAAARMGFDSLTSALGHLMTIYPDGDATRPEVFHDSAPPEARPENAPLVPPEAPSADAVPPTPEDAAAADVAAKAVEIPAAKAGGKSKGKAK